MVVAQFSIDRDINGAARDVEAAIQAARADLPTTLRSNPELSRIQSGRLADHHFVADLDTMTTAQLYDSADTVIQQQLSQISGVGQISSAAAPALGAHRAGARQALQLRHRHGGRARGGRRGQRRQRQGAYRSGRSALRGALQRSGDQGLRLSRSGRRLPQRRGGAAARCGRGLDSNENIRNAGLYNGLPTVGVVVFPLPGANIIKTVAQIKKVCRRSRRRCRPASTSMSPSIARSR
jgi:multidrug efflux pump